jgi:hypothetical protein
MVIILFIPLIAICAFLIFGGYVLIREWLDPTRARYSDRADGGERDYRD